MQLARLLINEDRHQSATPQVRCPKGNGGSDGIEGTWVSRRPEFGVRPRLGADGSGSIAHRARHHHGREGPAVAVPILDLSSNIPSLTHLMLPEGPRLTHNPEGMRQTRAC